MTQFQATRVAAAAALAAVVFEAWAGGGAMGAPQPGSVTASQWRSHDYQTRALSMHGLMHHPDKGDS